MSILKSNLKKVVCTSLCCAMLILGTGIMANAKTLTGGYSGSTAYATITNSYSSTRYCSVAILEYETRKTNSSTIASASGKVAQKGALTTSGKISKTHVYANGAVYKGNVPESGKSITYTVNIKS